MPNCTLLQQEILKRNHDDLMGGYYGFNRTYKIIAQKYTQKGLIKDLYKYLNKYNAC